MQRVFEQLATHANQRSEQPAFVQVTPLCAGPVAVTYAELHQAVAAWTKRLAERFDPGDVIVLCAYNRSEFVVGYLAGLAANLTVFPVYPSVSDAELRDAAIRSKALGYLGLPERFDAVNGLGLSLLNVLEATPDEGHRTLSPQCDQAAMLLQSSGTTGSPKIVRRTAASLDAVARNVADAVGLTRDDHVLAAIPMCHSYGVENALLGPLYAGCTVHVCDTFDTRLIVPELQQRGITIYPGTPFMFEMLAESMDRDAAPHLRAAYSAGAPLPVSVAEHFARQAGVPIGQLYGSTEIGSVTYNDPAQPNCDASSVGRPMNGVEIRILNADNPRVDQPLAVGEEGHVAIAAPSMLERYVDDTQPALTDGYFFTGDLGRLNEHGELTITGRVKLQIDIGGLKVNPLEVERVLKSHPCVGECVVVPAQVTATLVRLCAVITPRDGEAKPTADELRAFARQRLSRHKVPRLYEIRDSLPRTPSGKIQREAVQCA